LKTSSELRHSKLKKIAALAVLGVFLGGIVLQSQAQLTPLAFWKARYLWTWMGGSSTQTLSGIYGTMGTGSTANFPGNRQKSATWSDASGNFWVFGGYGNDIYGSLLVTNDLWKYTPADGKWTWMTGSPCCAPGGVYGTKGIGSTVNYPGGRAESVTWTDGSGNLWLFGGNGPDINGNWGHMNDLWKYTPGNGKWAWMAGATTNGVWGSYGTKGTAAAANSPGGRSDASGAIDASGNLWLFGGYGWDVAGGLGDTNDLWKFDPTTGYWTWISGVTTILSSANYGALGAGNTAYTSGARGGAAMWADASFLWMFGGYAIDAAGNLNDMNDLWKFELSTKKWYWVAGAKTGQPAGTYGTKGVGSTANIPGGREGTISWKDGSGNFWLFGGSGVDSILGHNSVLSDLWKLNPTNLQWTWVSGPNLTEVTGTYGTKGTGSTSNNPGPRYGSYRGFVDASGDFWIFGGFIFDANGRGTNGNDLWKFTVSNSNWTWMSGFSVNLQMPTYGTKGTGSTANTPGARSAFNTWVDASGNFWLQGGIGVDQGDNNAALNDLWKYAPGAKTWTWMSGSKDAYQAGTYGAMGTANAANTPGSRTRGATWVDASGNLWLFGGWGYATNPNTPGELNDMWKFDTSSSQWTWVSGSNGINVAGTYGSPGVGATTNRPGARESFDSWVDGAGALWIFGGYGGDSSGTVGLLNDLWRFTPADGKWTWMSGSSTVNSSGVYGAQGVASTGYAPSARNLHTAWVDSTGAFWIFCGYGRDSGGTEGNLNDLWRYTPADGKWTWMKGSNLANASGTYGTRGVGAAANTPGNRRQGTGWTDASGNLFYFSGNGTDNHGGSGDLNEWWRYSPSSNQWTWMGGSDVAESSGTYGSLIIPAPGNIPGGRSDLHPWVDGKGAVWFFGGQGMGDAAGGIGPGNDLWRFQP
jgi:N-acetylneuraminic acid mutarotase